MYMQHKIIGTMQCAIADLEGIMPEHDPSGDRKHPAWKTLDELKKLVHNLETNNVLFSWEIADVKAVRPDLDDEACRQVLEGCDDCHDASIGMNWDLIESVADNWYPISDEEGA